MQLTWSNILTALNIGLDIKYQCTVLYIYLLIDLTTIPYYIDIICLHLAQDILSISNNLYNTRFILLIIIINYSIHNYGILQTSDLSLFNASDWGNTMWTDDGYWWFNFFLHLYIGIIYIKPYIQNCENIAWWK